MTARVVEGLSQGIAELSLRSQALKLPLDELAARANALGERLEGIEERHRILPDMLAGEQRNLREEIEQGIASLRTAAEVELLQLLVDKQGRQAPETLPAAIERIFNAARTKMADDFSNRMKAILLDHQKRIDDDVEEVKRAAAEIFQAQLGDPTGTTTFTPAQEPYWVTQETGARLLPDTGAWFDGLLPAKFRAARTKARKHRQLNELIIRNAENLRWALLRKTDDSFREATANLQSRLGDALNGTRRVVDETLSRRRNESCAIEADLDRLRRAQELLSVLLRPVSDRRRPLDLPGGPNSISVS